MTNDKYICNHMRCKRNGIYVVVDWTSQIGDTYGTHMYCLIHAKWECANRRRYSNRFSDPMIYKVERIQE